MIIAGCLHENGIDALDTRGECYPCNRPFITHPCNELQCLTCRVSADEDGAERFHVYGPVRVVDGVVGNDDKTIYPSLTCRHVFGDHSICHGARAGMAKKLTRAIVCLSCKLSASKPTENHARLMTGSRTTMSTPCPWVWAVVWQNPSPSTMLGPQRHSSSMMPLRLLKSEIAPCLPVFI